MKEKNYKVAFFTLLGIVFGGLLATTIFMVTKKTSSNLEINAEYNNNKIVSSQNKSNELDKYDNSNELDKYDNSNIEVYESENNKSTSNTSIKKVSNSNSNKTSNNVVSNSNKVVSNSNKTSNKTSSTNKVTSNKNSNVVSNESEDKLTTADEKVINYLKEKQSQIESGTTKDKVKNIFIEVIDFLFYDGEIKGYTFNELTSKGKMEVTKLITKIEISIENKFPGVIDETKEKYREKKEQVITKYNETVNKYCSDKQDICDEFKRDYENMKNSFKNTFSVLKDLGSKGIEKGKEKFTEWYSNFKNK